MMESCNRASMFPGQSLDPLPKTKCVPGFGISCSAHKIITFPSNYRINFIIRVSCFILTFHLSGLKHIGSSKFSGFV